MKKSTKASTTFEGAATIVECSVCRDRHVVKARIPVMHHECGLFMAVLGCPKCSATRYYDTTHQVAWCWSNGLIEAANAAPPDSPDGAGCIEIARGTKSGLAWALDAYAVRGTGRSRGSFFVPGVQEAANGDAGVDALREWLASCRKRCRHNDVWFLE